MIPDLHSDSQIAAWTQRPIDYLEIGKCVFSFPEISYLIFIACLNV